MHATCTPYLVWKQHTRLRDLVAQERETVVKVDATVCYPEQRCRCGLWRKNKIVRTCLGSREHFSQRGGSLGCVTARFLCFPKLLNRRNFDLLNKCARALYRLEGTMTSRCRRRWERRCSSVWWPWPTARLPGMSAGLLEQQLAALSRRLLLGVRAPSAAALGVQNA